jgi:hypothetical protein
MSILPSSSDRDEDRIPGSPLKRNVTNPDPTGPYRRWKDTSMAEVSAALEKDVIFGLVPGKYHGGLMT